MHAKEIIKGRRTIQFGRISDYCLYRIEELEHGGRELYVNDKKLLTFDSGGFFDSCPQKKLDQACVFEYGIKEPKNSKKHLLLLAIVGKNSGLLIDKDLAYFSARSSQTYRYIDKTEIIATKIFDRTNFYRYSRIENEKLAISGADKIIDFSNGTLFLIPKDEPVGTVLSPNKTALLHTKNVHEGFYIYKNGAREFVLTPNILYYENANGMLRVALMANDGSKILSDGKLLMRQIAPRLLQTEDPQNEPESETGVPGNKYFIVLTKDRNDVFTNVPVWSPTIIDDHTVHYTDRYNFNDFDFYSDAYIVNTQFIAQQTKGETVVKKLAEFSLDEQTEWFEKILAARKIQADNVTQVKNSQYQKILPYWLGGGMDNDLMPSKIRRRITYRMANQILRNNTITDEDLAWATRLKQKSAYMMERINDMINSEIPKEKIDINLSRKEMLENFMRSADKIIGRWEFENLAPGQTKPQNPHAGQDENNAEEKFHIVTEIQKKWKKLTGRDNVTHQ